MKQLKEKTLSSRFDLSTRLLNLLDFTFTNIKCKFEVKTA